MELNQNRNFWGEYLITFTLFTLFFSLLHAQTEKKLLTVDDLLKWNTISEKIISDDGKWIATRYEPWKGASVVKLFDNKGKEYLSVDSASNINFSADSKYLIFKRGDKKREAIHIYNIAGNRTRVIDSLVSYQIPPKWSDYIVYKTKDSLLTVSRIDGKAVRSFKKIIEYLPAEGTASVLITNPGSVFIYDAVKESADTIFGRGKSVLKSAVSENGQNAALMIKDTLSLWNRGEGLKVVATSGCAGFPKGWRLSAGRDMKFSKNGSKLYFGTVPPERQRDTSVAKDDFPKVNIWHWKEGIQFTQQVVDKENELKRTYLAVYNILLDNLFQIAKPEIPEVTLMDEGNSDYVLATTNKRFQLEEMWEGRSRYDVYLINTALGRSSLIKEGLLANVLVSPAGKYLLWYNAPDSSWYTYSIAGSELAKITDTKSIKAADEENDYTDWPSSYSFAGWSEGEKEIFIYDRYDIWSVDPGARRAPVKITTNGRENGIVYRYLNLDKENKFIDLNNDFLLSGFNQGTKGSAYYSLSNRKGEFPKELVSGLFMLSEPMKAKNSGEVIYTLESFEKFPDIYLSDLTFKKSIRITNANPQQDEFNWGTAELVKWVSLDGKELEGVIYKPADFVPGKKYPMIVNFYERNSSTLFSYRIPEAHRSTVDYHLYTSNGYIIFNPDIIYKEGCPGESAYNCIMPGISKILNAGYVDKSKIGAQGHSWGGYQVAYMATRTNLFSAIESGAPVVNMFSAYGGIRWGTGLSRSFQLFTMDKVTTPVLIMANDHDGHVPWYQGIEYFIALKRLQKPVWLLNYTGEVHWPQKLGNKVDFQKRMFQFFNHYLKEEPMPKWMNEGLSAIDLDYELGY
ncbi:MAG: prolyl oligopeptidase family serine peptidase [Bacteroidales bacterium]